ncbi:gustatory receptor for sugar taste 43a-like [Diabrotica virgifera virgifera]|uniref:Gustatory receptor n=2 Tax=Diabrotica virgifera virgifera TaxID=50390 RepID=A0ABM5KNY6_DIAVI|nr:gustatory receptor for sugar taste 43a-like [Diabrotica virgifera virgifera]
MKTSMQKTIILTSSQYQLLRPIIWICKCFCILPFTIKKSDNVWWIYSSWWSVVTGAIGVITIGTLILYGIYTKYNMDVVFKLKSNSIGTKLVNGASISTLMTTFLICYLSSIINFKYLLEYFVQLSKADDFTKYIPSIQKYKIYNKILYSTILTKMFIYTTDLAVWAKIALPHSSITSYLIRQLPLYVLFVTMEFASIYYHFLVKCLNERLKYLNTRLKGYSCNYKNPDKKSIIDGSITKYDSKFFLQNDIMFDRRSVPFDESKINYLNGYECLFESSTALNNYFGAKLLILLFGVCFYLLRHPYDLYIAILNRDYLLMMLQVLWIIGHVWRLLLLIEPCNSVEQEVQKMSLRVCKLLSHNTEIQSNEKLQLLLSMLDRCPIKFTSCNIVAMDRHLLISIAGAVTTYLVILLQFGEEE